jgi:hypothetical protein
MYERTEGKAMFGGTVRGFPEGREKGRANPACTRPGQSRRFSIAPGLRSRWASDVADARPARRVMLIRYARRSQPDAESNLHQGP